MSPHNLVDEADEHGLSARRDEVRGDAAGLESLHRETLRFVARHLASTPGVARRIDRAFALAEDAMTPQTRLVVEMDAVADDVQLIIRVLDGPASSTPFELAEKSGLLEIWIRLNA